MALGAVNKPSAPSSMPELALMSEVMRICERHGALVFHSGDSRRDQGRGFPDLVIVSVHGVLWRELKTGYGPLSPHQTTWRHTLLAAGQDYDTWRPGHLDNGTIEKQIRAIA